MRRLETEFIEIYIQGMDSQNYTIKIDFLWFEYNLLLWGIYVNNLHISCFGLYYNFYIQTHSDYKLLESSKKSKHYIVEKEKKKFKSYSSYFVYLDIIISLYAVCK